MADGLRKWLITAAVLASSARTTIAQEPAGKKEGDKPGPGAAKRDSIYDRTADAKVQVAKAGHRAKHDEKRILLMFGGDWCGWCHELHDVFKTNTEVAQTLSSEDVLVRADTEAPNAAELLKTEAG